MCTNIHTHAHIILYFFLLFSAAAENSHVHTHQVHTHCTGMSPPFTRLSTMLVEILRPCLAWGTDDIPRLVGYSRSFQNIGKSYQGSCYDSTTSQWRGTFAPSPFCIEGSSKSSCERHRMSGGRPRSLLFFGHLKK